MTDSVPVRIGIGVVAVLAVVGAVFVVRGQMDNGESPNPNAGHPGAPKGVTIRTFSRQAADNMDEAAYMAFLKQNRPELSDAELKSKADRWWQVKSGQASPGSQ